MNVLLFILLGIFLIWLIRFGVNTASGKRNFFWVISGITALFVGMGYLFFNFYEEVNQEVLVSLLFIGVIAILFFSIKKFR